MLRRQSDLSEVNFGAPSAANFRALQAGELFLFKLHAPRNVIVGGGIFAYANALPCSLAWEAFGETNGARSAQEMRTRIAKYRRADPDDRSDFAIGCRILNQPFFSTSPTGFPYRKAGRRTSSRSRPTTRVKPRDWPCGRRSTTVLAGSRSPAWSKSRRGSGSPISSGPASSRAHSVCW